jgi:hypothetical protein
MGARFRVRELPHVVARLLIVAARDNSPVYDTGAQAHGSYSLGAGSRVQKERTAARAGSAPPRGCGRRTEGNFLNQCSGNEAPRAWPDGTTRRGSHGSVSRGDIYGSWRDRRWIDGGCVSRRVETARQSPIKPCRSKVQVLAPPAGSHHPLRWARGHCRYPKTRVPLAIV